MELEDLRDIFGTAVSQAELFVTVGTGPELISIVFYLCSSLEEFRRDHLIECIHVFCDSLRSSETRTIQVSYNALCFYYDQKIGFDRTLVSRHVADSAISDHALNFLVRLRHLSLRKELVSSLIASAAKDERATLALINAACDARNAELLLNEPSWLELRIPTMEYTLRLFLVIFCHQYLRSAIQKIQSIRTFVANICEEHNDPPLSIRSLIVQNSAMTKPLVDALIGLKLMGTIVIWARRSEIRRLQLMRWRYWLELRRLASHPIISRCLTSFRIIWSHSSPCVSRVSSA
jgi:hypothetical protein